MPCPFSPFSVCPQGSNHPQKMWFPISLEVLGFSLSTHGPCCLHDAWFPATWPHAPLLCPCLSVCCCNRTKAQKGQVTCQGFKTRQCDISCGQVLTTTLGFNVRMALKGDFGKPRNQVQFQDLKEEGVLE